MVPKTIMAFLVLKSKELAQSVLIERVYKDDDLDALLVEDPMVKAQRDNCKKLIAALKTAQSLLSEVSQLR